MTHPPQSSCNTAVTRCSCDEQSASTLLPLLLSCDIGISLFSVNPSENVTSRTKPSRCLPYSDCEPVVLDRFNVGSEERKRWLAIAMVGPKQAAAVFFNFDSNHCAKQVVRREDHPTIKTANLKSARRIVSSFSKQLTPPTTKEGFSRVYVVESYEDIGRIAQQL